MITFDIALGNINKETANTDAKENKLENMLVKLLSIKKRSMEIKIKKNKLFKVKTDPFFKIFKRIFFEKNCMNSFLKKLNRWINICN